MEQCLPSKMLFDCLPCAFVRDVNSFIVSVRRLGLAVDCVNLISVTH